MSFLSRSEETPVWDGPHWFIRSPVSRRLGFFPLLAVVNNAAPSVGGQVPVRVPASRSFGYIRSGPAGSDAESPCDVLRNRCTVFPQRLHGVQFLPSSLTLGAVCT